MSGQAPSGAGGAGELVKVAWARNQAEAELIQGLLEARGIPSMARRARGFDVPDFLAAGPREILVPPAAAAGARELLGGEGAGGEADANGSTPPAATGSPALRLAVGLAIALAVAIAMVLALAQLS